MTDEQIVRDVLTGRLGTHEHALLARDALDHLVARAEAAEEKVRRQALQLITSTGEAGEALARAEAAESRLATLTEAVGETLKWDCHKYGALRAAWLAAQGRIA